MAVLTIRPSRFETLFKTGSYAYIYATQAVHYLGELVTPVPVTVYEDAGSISADVLPSSKADEGESFTYTVGVFDDCGHKIYQVDIFMPEADADIFDLIPEPTNRDAFYNEPLADNSI